MLALCGGTNQFTAMGAARGRMGFVRMKRLLFHALAPVQWALTALNTMFGLSVWAIDMVLQHLDAALYHLRARLDSRERDIWNKPK